jgi:hypothetical protein
VAADLPDDHPPQRAPQRVRTASGEAGDLQYFWAAWVAGPAGAGLLRVSVGVTMIRRNRRSAAARRLDADPGRR